MAMVYLHAHAGWRLGTMAALLAFVAAIPAQPQTENNSNPQTTKQSQTMAPSQAPKTAPQVEETLASYEGQNVTAVEIGGQPDADLKKIGPLLVQKPGTPFAQEKIAASVAAMKQAGFQEVEVEVRPEAQGIRVLLVLQPAMYFGMYDFPGALGPFAYSRLVQVSNFPPQGAYTPSDIATAQDRLVRFFQRNGYFQAKVQPKVTTDSVHGLVNVNFQTTLGRRAKFGNVEITGPTPEQTAQLQQKLKSFMARLHTSDIRPGKPYRLNRVQRATAYLEAQLMKQDRLGAQVKLIGANYDPATNRADVEFNVQPGPLVHVSVQGAHLWSWTKRSLLPVYQANGLDDELVQEGRQNLISHWQDKGYFDTKVTVNVQQQPDGESISYQVTKGPRHKVLGVEIAGNRNVPSSELSGALQVEKGHFLISHGKYSEKLVRASVKALTGIYQANGFSSVKITPDVKTLANGNISVTFRVDEGPRDMVQSLQIAGNLTMPDSQLAPQGLKLAPGQPFSAKLVDQDKDAILTKYLNSGYLTANFKESAQPVNGDKHRLQVVYQIYEGPKVITEQVYTLGRKHTRQDVISHTASIETEQPLREDKLLLAESQLYTLGIFDWAEIDPRRQITTQTQEDVVMKVHEAKRNSINYGFGFEVVNRGGSVPSGTVAVPGLPPVGLPKNFKTSQKTFWGPRGSFQYERLNLRGKAETLTVGGLAGRLDQRANLVFTDPDFRMTNWTSSLSLTGEHNSTNPIFTARQGEAALQFQHALNPDKTNNLFLRYSFRETGITNLLIPDLVPAQDLHVRLSTFAVSFVRDTRDNVLDAHKGVFDTLELDLNPGFLGSNVSFARFLGQAAYYHKVHGDIVWASSLRLGLEQAFANSHVPISEEFFSGGGSTLRGFPLNGAGPQHTVAACGNPADTSTCSKITVPVGGNQLVILNSELRIPVPFALPLVDKKLSFVPFYDGGNVYQTVGFHDFWGNYSNNVGIGLRYATPIGPVRLDLGHNLNAQAGIKSTQVFITLGQAF